MLRCFRNSCLALGIICLGVPATWSDDLSDGYFTLGGTKFVQLEHRDNLTGPNDHLGSLLFDPRGQVAIRDEQHAWMYTGGLVDGKWISFVREFDLQELKVGPRTTVLTPRDDEKWSTIHLVIQVADDYFVAFYSTGAVVRAAASDRPDRPFRGIDGLEIAPTQAWERGCSLESDPGFVTIRDDDKELRIWLLYDTLGKDNRGGNGWAEVRIDKQRRSAELVRKHPQNPLPLTLPNRLTARTGGNLDSRLRIDGKFALFYLSKPDAKTYRLAAALSDDPLFQQIAVNQELSGPLGEERVIEKFHGCLYRQQFLLFYEYATEANDWRTAIRRYRLESP